MKKTSVGEKRYTQKQLIGSIVLTLVLTMTAGLVLLSQVLGSDGMAVVEGFALTRLLFVGEADFKTAGDDALNALVSSTGDRWTFYLDQEWNASNRLSLANETKGIGVRVLLREDGLFVTDVIAGSGAEEAGIRKEELLVAVDGSPLFGERQRENLALISGEEGTRTVITVRDIAGMERELSVLRGTWFDPPVRSTMLPGEIGCVRLFNFNTGVNDALRTAVDELVSQGARGLVFDVRQNSGGYVTELTEILDYLLPEGVVFRQTTSWGWSFSEESDGACIDLPMAVLVDRNSYSAAEIFAAQLRESVGAYIVGEHTSGKGYFQYAFPLSNGGSLGLSMGTYTTGGGVSLIGTGLEPDALLSLTPEQESDLSARWLKAEEDPQLQTALNWFDRIN